MSLGVATYYKGVYMSKLTDTAIKAVKANGKNQKISDGGGLYLFVSPQGGKAWRVKYRFAGKEKILSLGKYPQISLAAARKLLMEAKEKLAQGIDPSAHKKAVKEAAKAETENSFEIVAREWFAHNKNVWSEVHTKKVLARLENDLIPFLGNKTINTITPPELLILLRKIESRGAIDTAHRTLNVASLIFRYAIATGRAERDTAADLRGALIPTKTKSYATITNPAEIGILLKNIDEYSGNDIVKAALKLAPYIFVRPGELRRAEWSEFDLEIAEWRIPAERMKMRVVHIVPLAKQVVELLNELQQFTGHTKYLFPSMRANSAPISDMTLLAGLRRMGYSKDEMTVHGFRSMASTLLNEQGYNRDWIERQLAHGERNGVRAAYNYAEYLPERRRMMQEWADYLTELRK